MEFIERNADFITKSGRHIIASVRNDTDDFNCLRAGIDADEYQLSDINFKDDDVVIDIGSATGGEAMLLAAINSKMRILSFEPIPENIIIFNKNIKANGFGNIKTFPLAVTGKTEKVKIFYGDPSTPFGKAHYFVATPIKNPERSFIEVQGTTLEDIFKFNGINHCKLLKLDAEGSELEILQNAPLHILSKIDWILGEHHIQKRDEMLKATRGLFEDVPCDYQVETTLGHFRFRRK